jgi:hypothetical protein
MMRLQRQEPQGKKQTETGRLARAESLKARGKPDEPIETEWQAAIAA